MYSAKDFERLWFLYKTEGEPKGVSINSFCMLNNVPYTQFYDWYRKIQKKAVPVEVTGVPDSVVEDKGREDTVQDEAKSASSTKGNIMVAIKTRDGLCIQKKGLDYQGLKALVEKLEGLC